MIPVELSSLGFVFFVGQFNGLSVYFAFKSEGGQLPRKKLDHVEKHHHNRNNAGNPQRDSRDTR